MSARVDYSSYTTMIRDRLSALDVGKDYGLEVGRDGRCRCIFCTGARDDTLRLYPGDRGAYCFRCHKGVDVIGLVMEITGNNFPETVRELNNKYGLGLPLDKPDPEAERKAREEAERRKQERIAQEKRNRDLLEALWDASDKVAIAEEVLANEGPRTPSEPFSARYIKCARKIHELREERDRLFDLVYVYHAK